mmetsp:Transcript_23974/g.27436  ORF Transcript_23974/g.27436 Transcript_23974/m.27436 type:complete len:975 (+) Transcript_23974:160-3084(+)
MFIYRTHPRRHLFRSIVKEVNEQIFFSSSNPLSYSKFRHLHLFEHGHLSSSSSKSFRIFRPECQRFSSIITATTATTTGTGISPVCLSTRMKDATIVANDDDWLTSFLDSFAQKVDQDVINVISKVDANSESNLMEQWKRILEKENDLYRRHLQYHNNNTIRPNDNNSMYSKPSMENIWKKVFHRYEYRDIQRLYKEGVSLDGLGILNDDKNKSEDEDTTNNNTIDEPSHDIHLSPIFQFPVNEHLSMSLKDFQKLTLSKREEEDDNDIAYSGGSNKLQSVIMSNVIKNDENEREKKVGSNVDVYHNAILRSMSLLIAMKPEDWRRFDSGMPHIIKNRVNMNENSIENNLPHTAIRTEPEFVIDGTNTDEIKSSNITNVREFLRNVTQHKSNLTTLIINLVLAHLVASTEIEDRLIGVGCLQIFEEMKNFAESGHQCRPDSTTYRILILAFSRRLQGAGEAINLSQDMVMERSSIIDDITPELLMDALRACHAKQELTVATSLMNTILRNKPVRFNVGSCILFTEMMKYQNLGLEAIGYFSRIQQANVLTKKDEDKYLVSLCRWPTRNRRGDMIELSSFWKNILVILENKTLSTKKPDRRVWITFMSGLYQSTKNDSSLWNLVASATKTILDSYPRNFVDGKLVAIGLDASSFTEDSKLASTILNRVANESIIRNPPSNYLVDDSQTMIKPEIVPFRALKNALKTCLRTSDVRSARSIRASLDQLNHSYPIGAQSELHALVLLCHTKVGDAENAKRDLRIMIDHDMKPGEELYSAVLHTLAAMDRYQEMEELFQSMVRDGENGIKPGVSSFDAILLARIRAQSWDGTIALYDQMKIEGITPSSRTIQSLLVAYDQKGERISVLSALDSFLISNAQFDEGLFRFVSKTLFKEVDKNLDDFRQTIREIGERYPNLRDSSINLVRSIRDAEIESSRPKTRHKSQYEIEKNEKEFWQLATFHLVEFLKESKQHENDTV